MFRFLRNTKLYMVLDGKGYHFNTLSNLDGSQVFEETSVSRKTIHNPVQFDRSLVNRKGIVSLDFEVYVTKNGAETALFELAGFTKDNLGDFNLSNIAPLKEAEFYIENLGVYHKISNCVLVALELEWSPKGYPTLRVTCQGSEMLLSTRPPVVFTPQQNYLDVGSSIVYLDSVVLPRLRSANFSLERRVTWRDNQSVHGIGTIHINKRPYITKTSIAGILTCHSTSNNNISTYSRGLALTYGSFSISMNPVVITERDGIEPIYTKYYDYKLQDAITKAKISFRGNI